ncbi:MAG: molybdate ABC transporter substrate-binding protein [Proteobacteria bacterium]|nr:molybdate ABC transporter substrate-binding protein [Pseudomonadota bacterium]
MQKRLKKNIIKNFFFGFFVLCVFSNNSFAAASKNLTVFAEQNMVPAFIKIARLYSQKNYTIVSINFNSSGELISDVDSGEPADIFISAHAGWIETLKQKGLTDVYNTGHIARDRLVLVTSKNNPNILPQLLQKNLSLEESLKILNQFKATLIIDQENNSSGKCSNDLIKSLELYDLKLFLKLSEDNSAGLNFDNDNPRSYAMLLESQIKNKPNLKVLAKQKASNIFYQALVIAGDNMETAREFLKFLKSKQAKIILSESGFIVD